MTPAGLLDDLLEAERSPLLSEDAGSRARWAKWEKLHGSLVYNLHNAYEGRVVGHTKTHVKLKSTIDGSESEVPHSSFDGGPMKVGAHPKGAAIRSGVGKKKKLQPSGHSVGSGASVGSSAAATERAKPHNQIARLEKELFALPQGNTNRTPAQLARAAAIRAQIRKLREEAQEGEAEFALAMLRLTEAGLWVQESAKTAGYSVKHSPRGKGGTNWITKSKPGNTGELPAYIQNVRNGIMKSGKSLSKATAIAIGRLRTWASGGGGVHAEVKAASAKALAQFDKMRKKVGRSSSGAKKLAEELGVEPGWLAEAEGDDADFDFTALLAQIRAQPNAVPFIAHVRSVPPTAPAISGSYPDDEGGEVSIGEGLEEATTSRQRWAKYDQLNQGTSGAPVQGVQARVGAKQDGQYGAKTAAKVKAFQQKNGLQVDGVVGRQTFAALAGHKNASSVKVGKLSTNQVSQLANFAKHGGTLMTKSGARKRAARLNSARLASAANAKQFGKVLKAALEEAESAEEVLALMLVEAERATHAEFPDRVKALKQGEVARMPDGHAVRRISTQDGRDVFQVGSPSAYGDNPGAVSYYSDHHRKAEDAVQSARARSARSTDPESLGGETSYFRHDSVTADGRPAVFQGVDMSGDALVRHGGSARAKAVPFSKVARQKVALRESTSEVVDRFTPFS